MRNSISLVSILLLGLFSCGGEEAASSGVTYTDANAALDQAATAMNSKDYSTAVEGYIFAMENSSNNGTKTKIAAELFKAHVKNNDNSSANALLDMMGKDLKEELNSDNLTLLANFCLINEDASMAQSVLGLATDALAEGELAKFDPENVALGIEAAKRGDKNALAALGYVGD
jgi:outer membrane PBP1 activator LpoA protein